MSHVCYYIRFYLSGFQWWCCSVSAPVEEWATAPGLGHWNSLFLDGISLSLALHLLHLLGEQGGEREALQRCFHQLHVVTVSYPRSCFFGFVKNTLTSLLQLQSREIDRDKRLYVMNDWMDGVDENKINNNIRLPYFRWVINKGKVCSLLYQKSGEGGVRVANSIREGASIFPDLVIHSISTDTNVC